MRFPSIGRPPARARDEHVDASLRPRRLVVQPCDQAQAFLTLHAKKVVEEALAAIGGATQDLRARAAEMPVATKTVEEVRPMVSAGVAVGTAIGRA